MQQVPTLIVRLKRHREQVVYPYDVYIGRAMNMGGWRLPESKWANPYRIGQDGTRDDVLEKYESYVRGSPDLLRDLHELRGKRLGCWCVDPQEVCSTCREARGTCEHPYRLICHGDILVKLLRELNEQVRAEDAEEREFIPDDDPFWDEIF